MADSSSISANQRKTLPADQWARNQAGSGASAPIIFESLDELQSYAVSHFNVQSIKVIGFVLGYNTRGDRQLLVYLYDALSDETADGKNIIQPPNTNTGRWIRVRT